MLIRQRNPQDHSRQAGKRLRAARNGYLIRIKSNDINRVEHQCIGTTAFISGNLARFVGKTPLNLAQTIGNQIGFFIDTFLTRTLLSKQISSNDIPYIDRRTAAEDTSRRGSFGVLRPESHFRAIERQEIVKRLKLGVTPLVLLKSLLQKAIIAYTIFNLGIHVHPLFKCNDTAFYKPGVLRVYRWGE